MIESTYYYRQVELLLKILPLVAQEECFALKGGTAINLFIRDLPRLSVDIDLVYLPLESRGDALVNANEALNRIIERVEKINAKAFHTKLEDSSLRIIIQQNDVSIKLELSPVMRGVVFPPENREVRESVEDEFGYVEMLVTSFEDLYAGKMCAALDRQHPRDLYDIKTLLENEGLSDRLRKTFLVYLISHHRPISEVLFPKLKTNIRDKYNAEFENMSKDEVSIEELEATFYGLVHQIHDGLSDDEKAFLLSFKGRNPDWSLLGLNGVQDLPAVKWKLINLNKMSDESHQLALDSLKSRLLNGG